jgi:Fe-S cluster biogenesis protein NfuA
VVEPGHELAGRGVAQAVEDSLTVTDLPTYPFEILGEHPDGAARVTALSEVIEVIRPVIAADGGSLDVLGVDVDAGIVRLQLSGACGSCAVSAATLNDGINRILRDRLSWITEVIGGIEESDVSGMGGWTPKHS